MKRASILVLSLALVVASGEVLAAGKKPPSNGGGGSCGPGGGTGTQANPIRKVVINPVSTMPFNLPNGSRVNLQADLTTILATAVAESGVFVPLESSNPEEGVDDPCGVRLEIVAGVSSFQASVVDMGVDFGYSPSGENSTVSDVNASANIQIGKVTMDFRVRYCVNGSCVSPSSSTASAATAGGNLNLTIDFGQIQTSPDLVFNTDLGKILRRIMVQGMQELGKADGLDRLPWRARVREYIPEAGMLIFDAGTSDRIGVNQAFEVYAVTPSVGVCDVFKAVARIHTTQVNSLSSTAVVDSVLDPRGIKDGDVVTVRKVDSR